MGPFHDHDLPGRNLLGRHGVSTHIAPVVLDLHRAATSGIQWIPLPLRDESAVILLGVQTGLLLEVNTRINRLILRGGFVELFALVHHCEHHPDVRLELLLALRRYPRVVQSLKSMPKRLDCLVVPLQGQQAPGPSFFKFVEEILRVTQLQGLLDVSQRVLVTLQAMQGGRAIREDDA